MAARILMSRAVGGREYTIRIWAPFLLRNRAFHLSALVDGVHVYPLEPVEVVLWGRKVKRIYSVRVFHTKGWFENLMSRVSELASSDMIRASLRIYEKLSRAESSRVEALADRLESSGLIGSEEAEELRRLSSSGASVLAILRKLRVSHPTVQALVASALLDPSWPEEVVEECRVRC